MTTRGSWFMRDIPVMLWLSAAAILALVHPVFDSSRWLMVHLVALGGLTHSIVVWSAHFTGALLKTKNLNGRRIQNIRLILLQVGLLAVFIGDPTAWWPLTVTGATLISGVIVWHAAMLIYRLRNAMPGRFRITVRYYIVAACFFPVGALIGVLLARGLSGGWHGKLLVAHTMIYLLGWVGLSILGTLVTLWPSMLRTRMAQGAEHAAIRALPVLAVGISVVVASPLVDLTWLGVLGVALYFVGTMTAYMPIWQAARRKGPHSFPTLSASAALVWLPVALVTLMVKIVVDGWQQLATSYGVLTVMFLVGFALQMLLGALSYLLPVVIGGGPRPLRAGIQELNRLGTWRVFTVNIAIAVGLLPVAPGVRVVVSGIGLIALALTLVLMLRGLFVTVRAKRAVAAGTPPPKPHDTTGITHPKISAPQIVVSIAIIALGAAIGAVLHPSAVSIIGVIR